MPLSGVMLGEFDVVTGGPDGGGWDGFWATANPVKATLHPTIEREQSSVRALQTGPPFDRFLKLLT